jgi:hypothetical protein
MAQAMQQTELDLRKKRAKRTALIVGAIAVAIFVLSIVQMLKA